MAIYGDLFAALAWRELPLLWPLSISTVGFSALAIKRAGSRFSEGPALPSSSGLTLLIANTYLMHWFLVIPWVGLKMALAIGAKVITIDMKALLVSQGPGAGQHRLGSLGSGGSAAKSLPPLPLQRNWAMFKTCWCSSGAPAAGWWTF